MTPNSTLNYFSEVDGACLRIVYAELLIDGAAPQSLDDAALAYAERALEGAQKFHSFGAPSIEC